MGQLKITEIEAGLKDWEFLTKLPKEINGFMLQPGAGISGQELNIASYVNESMHSKVELIYTSETFDYVPVKHVGMHRFRDDRFFCRDREKFAELMLSNLPKIIDDINRNCPHYFTYEAKDQKFSEWDYWKKLPQRIGNFELFITPDNPLHYINGSILFLDYTDFVNGNQLYFLYNTFRDELFAELKKGYIPCTTDAFNADSLEALAELLDSRLEEVLKSLGKN